jgi:predicted transcriptional regulator
MSGQLNVDLGDKYKEKLEKIAENQNRSMTSQIRHWIDQVKTE